MNKIVLILVLVSVEAWAMGDYSELSRRGSEAIEMCSAEYTQIKRDAFPPGVDRAYVYAGNNMLGVLFAHGEVGTFGKRDENYQAFVSCSVALQPKMHVQELREGYSILKGSEEAIADEALYNGDVDELLYIRDEMTFRFKNGQAFSPEKIDRLQLRDGNSDEQN